MNDVLKDAQTGAFTSICCLLSLSPLFPPLRVYVFVSVYPERWLSWATLGHAAVHRASLAQLQSALRGKHFLAKLISVSGEDLGNESRLTPQSITAAPRVCYLHWT